LERNGKSLGELPIISIQNPTLAHFRHFSSLLTNFRSTTVENSLQINPFYAKQSQFPKTIINVNSYMKSIYEISGTWWIGKTKPIQTQFKANKANNKPNLSQNKPNSNPNKANFEDFLRLDNRMCSCYISLSEFLYGQIVKIGKRII
jgi:hypothetical protein